MPTVVDGFEDGDLSEYYDPFDWSTVSSTDFEGNYYLRFDGGTNQRKLYSTSFTVTNSDLPLTALFRWDSADFSPYGIRTWFAVQDESASEDGQEGFYVDADPQNGNFLLYWQETGSGDSTKQEVAGDYSVSINGDTIHRVEITQWDGSGTYGADLIDTSDGTTISSISGTVDESAFDFTPTYYTSGGIGFVGDPYSASTGSIIHWDHVAKAGPPDAPSNLSVSQGSENQLDLSWTDNSADEDGFYVYRALSSGSSTSDYTQIADLAADTTSYTDTGLSDGEKYFYRVSAYNSQGESSLTNEGSAVTILPAPSGVGASYVADDSIDVSWTDTIDNGNYHIQISRDGASYTDPSGGSTTVGHNTTSVNYGPNSDNSYDSQVGIDSSFQFRVRSETSHTSSGWVSSSTVYTDPIPPHKPYVDSRDSTQLNINWSNQSDIYDHVEAEYRVDTGSGYGSWTSAFTDGDTAHHIDNDKYSWFNTDSRYQFRVRTISVGGDASEWVYADYGNGGNVYFSDGFESGDFSGWDSHTNSGSRTYVSTSLDGYDGSGSIIDSDPPEGSYGCQLAYGDYVQQNLGDLSGESDVIVKAYLQAGSLDSSSEVNYIRWYDGSSWQDLHSHSHEHNKQGWFEITALVPSSWLSTDNRVRFRCYPSGGAGDFLALDRVIVSDILHEHTKPATPTNLSVDTSVEDEITVSFTNNASFVYTFQYDHREAGGTWSTTQSGSSSETFTGLEDGEKYQYRTYIETLQHRHGSYSTYWYSDKTTGKYGTTILPAPSSFSLDASVEDEISMSWTNNDDSSDGDIEVYKRKEGGSYSVDATFTDLTTASYTATGLDDGELYYFYVERSTDHTSSTSSTKSAVTILPAPTDYSHSPIIGETNTDVSWADNADAEDGYRVYYKESSAGSFTQFSDLGANTTSDTITGLSSDTSYDSYVEVYTDNTAKTSSTITFTTPKILSRVAGIDGTGNVSATRSAITRQRFPGIHGSGSTTASRVFAQVFEDQSAVGLDFHVITDPVLAFASEWVEEGAEPFGDEADAFSVTFDAYFDGEVTVRIQYDGDGDGIPDATSDPVTLGRSSEVATFNEFGEPGYYRLLLSDIQRNAFFRVATWGPTRL